ncbi:MAG: hypothetical protein IT233_00995 [Bacteroidia bacterium]|nr:hypothetical protein [Bacteroidia bacterium]
MKKNILFLLLILTFSLRSQKSYFQQEVNYTIQVKLDDVNHELDGNISIVYTNNSPDKLNFIWMHLWPNAYKNNQTALGKQLLENGSTRFQSARDDERGCIDKLQFKVNGQDVEVVQHPDWIDVCQIFLTRPMEPGEKIIITTPFHVKIPIGVFSRMGHIGQQYQITQWYPKPAVYDKHGWHPMPYLDQGEFYSEYGSFDVSITLPENYVIKATGDLVDGEKEYEWWRKKDEETRKKNFEENTTLPNGKETPLYNDEFPESSANFKTLRFRQQNVHDFAWFADKRYNMLRGEVELPHSKRKVETWLIFTNGESKLWKDAVPYINDAIYYYSLWNGDYPYAHATAVDGALSAGGGMEYPNITVIGQMSNPFLLETVIMHEVGHNWFYGILGSNERQHPWMDEGINSFNENRYIETKYPKAGILGESDPAWYTRLVDLDNVLHKEQYYYSYLIGCKVRKDQPIEEQSAKYTPFNYGGIVYSKTAIMFDYLMAWLGEQTMDKAMQLYFDTWKFKHPYPEDLRFVMEKVSGKDLGWFFDEIIGTTRRIDFKITGVEERDGKYTVTVKNTGEITAPVNLYAFLSADSTGTSLGWSEPLAPGKSFSFTTDAKEVRYFRIDPRLDIPEYNRNNNIMRSRGILKKTEPLQFKFIGSLDSPERTSLYWVPAGGWNYYDGAFAGLVMYNNLIPQKHFEFTVAPMFGLYSRKPIGIADASLHFHPQSLFSDITFSGRVKKFSYHDFPSSREFMAFRHSAHFVFRNKNPRDNKSHSVTLSDHRIFAENFAVRMEGAGVTFDPVTDETVVQQFTYQLRVPHAIHGWNTGVIAEYSKDHMKLMWKGNFQYHFVRLKRSAELRLSGGMFLQDNGAAADKYSFRLNNATGAQDYLYEDAFLARNMTDGLLSRQIGPENSNFTYDSPVGVNKKWMASAHLRIGIPRVPLLKLYGSFAFIPEDSAAYQPTQFEAGVFLGILNETITVYIPLVFSEDLANDIALYGWKRWELIRFSLDLNRVNPLNMIRNLDL